VCDSGAWRRERRGKIESSSREIRGGGMFVEPKNGMILGRLLLMAGGGGWLGMDVYCCFAVSMTLGVGEPLRDSGND
jgi:hypothetical protein